jgi:hypothetical protein
MYDNIIMADKVEKHREAVRRYREKLGIDKVRELTKGYIKNKRNEDKDYYKNELEKNKLRAQDKSNQRKIEKLNAKFEAIAVADDMVNKICENAINDIPEKRGRGRPKLTDEQKAERKVLRNAK